jgi:HAD superfamily hydrolase (TIGR01450 family)
MSGEHFLPGAVSFLSALDLPFFILSNDSEHTEQQLAQLFRRNGIVLAADRFILAGVALIENLAIEEPGVRVMILGSPQLQRLARNRRLEVTDVDPDVVLVMRDRQFSYGRLATAARAIHRGARLIVTCPDTAHPGPLGEPVPESGALAAALLACVGPIAYRVFGKPEPDMFRLALTRLGLQPCECVMIGDNPNTDGKGALRAGMLFYQVARPGIGYVQGDGVQPAREPEAHVAGHRAKQIVG